ncbi:MAG: hypothetical protein F6K54_41080 [Okeania sp. SIO3B5]|uniref:hypothetical protein n=1 Tax=Okeania sp. SIO3B5 TaxID=2607811 RepID=UPI0013FF8E4F|nr:hypothetical protein [Okeania sp. SIO3B5]NEO58867.1 hypothetical protein [Okeania sp. SIO3B5]
MKSFALTDGKCLALSSFQEGGITDNYYVGSCMIVCFSSYAENHYWSVNKMWVTICLFMVKNPMIGNRQEKE